ncbi:hypothetical protein XENORESO_018767 [Xenotaenia resolanae]|uniref:Uncharacterized protein n=1 Tax=Xenotaenia resolanae TaxID=208358 RepID=A0ABV0W999_9TELE
MCYIKAQRMSLSGECILWGWANFSDCACVLFKLVAPARGYYVCTHCRSMPQNQASQNKHSRVFSAFHSILTPTLEACTQDDCQKDRLCVIPYCWHEDGRTGLSCWPATHSLKWGFKLNT